MIVYVTTADTEILALSRAVRELPDDFLTLKVVNPNRLPKEMAPESLITGASMALVRAGTARSLQSLGADIVFYRHRETVEGTFAACVPDLRDPLLGVLALDREKRIQLGVEPFGIVQNGRNISIQGVCHQL
jgi:hypothetical protein